MKLYLSGPISSDLAGYKQKFDAAQSYLETWKGHVVLNPAALTDQLAYEDYFKIDYAMIDVADGIVLLRGWKNSEGAKRELAYAILQRKKVFYGIESVPITEEGEKTK